MKIMSKRGEDLKKGLRRKMGGFSLQTQSKSKLSQNPKKNKKKGLRRKLSGFSVRMRMET